MAVLQALDSLQLAGNLIGSFRNYFSTLQPASFNSVPFFTRSNSTTVGRRVAEHIYPFRDQPWIEDIGRKARVYHIVGFLIGDDVISQRDKMQAELERAGSGVLIHPTYGRLNVSALDQCTFEEDLSHGRVIEMNLVFEESGLKIYPGVSGATADTVDSKAANGFEAIINDYTDGLVDDAKVGFGQLLDVVDTTNDWINSCESVVASATSIYSLGVSVVGSLGRFFGASAGTTTGSINGPYLTPTLLSASMSTAIVNGANDRQLVTDSTEKLSSSVSDAFIPANYANAVSNVVATILRALPDPASLTNAFAQLNDISTPSITADLLRRSAAIGLAQAAAQYQPTSQNDAANLQDIVVNILDDEILIAGDQGDDQTFYALTDLRNSIAQYLISEGSALPPLQNFSNNNPLPALMLAYEYYNDITRTDQLIAAANPVHPAFMPISFIALSY
jgi:prophage DNA circulation protein